MEYLYTTYVMVKNTKYVREDMNITSLSSPPLSSYYCSEIHHHVHENQNTQSTYANNYMYTEMGFH